MIADPKPRPVMGDLMPILHPGRIAWRMPVSAARVLNSEAFHVLEDVAPYTIA